MTGRIGEVEWIAADICVDSPRRRISVARTSIFPSGYRSLAAILPDARRRPRRQNRPDAYPGPARASRASGIGG